MGKEKHHPGFYQQAIIKNPTWWRRGLNFFKGWRQPEYSLLVNILPGEDTRSFAGKINRYGRKWMVSFNLL